MDAVKRLYLREYPASGKLSEYTTKIANDKATIHQVVRATGFTVCGKEVPKKDKRWIAMRGASAGDINCARCIAKSAAKSAKPAAAKKAAKPARSRSKVTRVPLDEYSEQEHAAAYAESIAA